MADRLREVLREAGYSDEGLAQALQGSPGFGLPGFDPALVARRLAPGTMLSDLVTLFLLGGDVRRRRAERLFGRKPLANLITDGILQERGEAVRARIAIHVWGPLLLACDRHDTADRQDHVVGMTGAAATLAHLTIRSPGARALDLGTGCGVAAVLAARHADRVTATDFNPRALRLAALTARLNGAHGAELLEGDWFAPVEGRAFDLIVSNPPFVISPDTTFTYRDGEGGDDGVSEHVVRESARHLAPGGHATVLCNWIRRDEAEAEAPLRWVRGTGCDAIVIRYGLDDPVSYAASWSHHLRGDPAAFEAVLERWTEHYRSLGVRALASGAVVLHRTGRERSAAFEAVESPSVPAEAQLRRMFAALEDPELGSQPLPAAEGTVVEQTHVRGGARFETEGGLVYGPAGVGVEVTSEVVAQILRGEVADPVLASAGLVG